MSRRRTFNVAATVLALAGAVTLAACTQFTQLMPAPPSLVEMLARPAEKALLAGLRAYDDALYTEAQRFFFDALNLNLASPKDRAAAHKHLAFIYCTSKRMAECEAQFRAALLADPSFTLSKSEAGHPKWGEVYKRTQP